MNSSSINLAIITFNRLAILLKLIYSPAYIQLLSNICCKIKLAFSWLDFLKFHGSRISAPSSWRISPPLQNLQIRQFSIDIYLETVWPWIMPDLFPPAVEARICSDSRDTFSIFVFTLRIHQHFSWHMLFWKFTPAVEDRS